MNACYEELRRHRRWTTRIRALPVDGPGGPDMAISVDDRDALDRAFARLSPDHRTVFVLHHHARVPADRDRRHRRHPGRDRRSPACTTRSEPCGRRSSPIARSIIHGGTTSMTTAARSRRDPRTPTGWRRGRTGTPRHAARDRRRPSLPRSDAARPCAVPWRFPPCMAPREARPRGGGRLRRRPRRVHDPATTLVGPSVGAPGPTASPSPSASTTRLQSLDDVYLRPYEQLRLPDPTTARHRHLILGRPESRRRHGRVGRVQSRGGSADFVGSSVALPRGRIFESWVAAYREGMRTHPSRRL